MSAGSAPLLTSLAARSQGMSLTPKHCVLDGRQNGGWFDGIISDYNLISNEHWCALLAQISPVGAPALCLQLLHEAHAPCIWA